MLDLVDRLAENKSDAGGMGRRVRSSIVVESVTVVEQAMRLALEPHLVSRGETGRVVETISDIGRDASVPRARVSAGFRTYQSVEAVRSTAREFNLAAVIRWLDEEGGAEALGKLLGTRHTLVHTLGFVIPDDVGACDAAWGLVRAVLDGSPVHRVVALLVEGSWMDMAGRVDDARAAYEGALDECRALMAGGDPAAWLRICAGHALVHLGRAGEADASLRDALAADPRSAVARLELGNIMMLDGRREEAYEMYSESLKCDPEYAPAYLYRGHALQMREGPDHTLVVEDYTRVLALDPQGISAYVGRGMSLAERGLHAEAAAEFERDIEIDGSAQNSCPWACP